MDWMPFVNWLFGFISCIIVLFALPENPEDLFKKAKPSKKKLPWKEIDNLDIEAHFDAEWIRDLKAQELAHMVSMAAHEKSKDLDFSVEPGKYSVSTKILTKFVKRE